jgi:hypothetical protein
MPQFDSISTMIDECFERDESRENNWYERYKATHEKVMVSPGSDESLELLWFVRDNAVSSLMQGNTSKKEFEGAKAKLRSITVQIADSPTPEMYDIAVKELEKLKSEGTFRYFYGALLNRVFAAIAPSKVTSSVKEPAFAQAANFINNYFKLGLSLTGNWFQNNVELKSALRQKLPDDYDDFKINIAIWNVYELLEDEKRKAVAQHEEAGIEAKSHFILQGNPEKFNIDEYLSNNIDIFWTASRYASEMSLGDIVTIWRSGQDAGAVARGTINVLPQTIKQLKESEYLGEDLWRDNNEPEETKKVGVELDGFRLSSNEGMLTREELKQDDTLRDALIIKSPQGTVFKLTENEATRINELWNAKQWLEDRFIQSQLTSPRKESITLSVKQYKDALSAKHIVNEKSLLLLKNIYNAPTSGQTSDKVALALGYPSTSPANGLLGKLSKRIAKYFEIEKDEIDNTYTGWWPLVLDPDGGKQDNKFIWKLRDNLRLALDELDLFKTLDRKLNPAKKQSKEVNSLNQIFYGPPGTGKTYTTIEASVRAAEPTFTYETRNELKLKYDELVSQKRIQFVTFHQSYGYEEFVEGLSAKTEGDQVSYYEKDGIFKTICKHAARGVAPPDNPIEDALNRFKDDIESQDTIALKTTKGKTFNVAYYGNTTFRVFPEETIQTDLGKGYAVSIDNIKRLYHSGEEADMYNVSYVRAILKHIVHQYKVPNIDEIRPNKPDNFVLIIDEINRGNISKVFGELITLIESSKRTGNDEAIEVVLPHSGERFSVPQNLYIIGTMNTADRSLAMMDTALRRRFDFIEMMPDYSVLAGVEVKGIALDQLLHKMNARIEALYDREHMLGHAFLIPVKKAASAGDESGAFQALKHVFINKFIPLLEEYFFDDWNKIRLVLGDNQKPESLQFIKAISHAYDDLFGNNHRLDSYINESQTFELATPFSQVWNEPAAYVGIFNSIDEL